MNIPKEEQINYKYIGSSLVYDPEKPLSVELDQTRIPLPGNRGIFAHPSFLRPRTTDGSGKGPFTRKNRYMYTTYQDSATKADETLDSIS